MSDEKSKALLHGHSYTAHAVGCGVAVESVKTLMRLDRMGDWMEFQSSWDGEAFGGVSEKAWSMWSLPFVTALSHKSEVAHVIALGSVLAIHLKDKSGSSGMSFFPPSYSPPSFHPFPSSSQAQVSTPKII